jgi:ketosteroid isomerase-like protein
MSAKLDLVRSIYAVWERGDFSAAEWAHPETEFEIADGPAPGGWTGQAGMADGFRDFVNAWEQYRVGADEYRELDGEYVLVFVHLNARGKTSGLELGQRADPKIEFVRADGLSPDSWTGLAGMAEGFRDFLSAWEEAHVKADEYRELDAERVPVLSRYSGRGKTSGLELGQIGSEVAGVFHVRDGKVTRLVLYVDRERAFADLGLEE